MYHDLANSVSKSPAVAVRRFIFILIVPSGVFSQISTFPHIERFDSVSVPAPPAGWTAIGFTTHTTASNSALIPRFLIWSRFAHQLTEPLLASFSLDSTPLQQPRHTCSGMFLLPD